MTNIKDKIDNLINEGKYFENSDVLPTIKMLGEMEWSKGKKKQIGACEEMLKIAKSNENISNTFMREMDKASTGIAKSIIEKVEKQLFAINKK